jgi:signal transduction histidine kinase/CheY-like chemotaxis protein
VVECEEERAAWLATSLASHGYDVAVAHDLGKARAAVSVRRPEAAVVGHVRGADRREVGARLRADGIPVVIVFVPPTVLVRSPHPPDPDLVAEPVDAGHLVAAVDARLRAAVAVEPNRIAAALAGADEGSIHATRAEATPDPGLFDALDDGVALVGHDGGIIWSNAALGRLLGVAPAALRGRSLPDLVPHPGVALIGDGSETPWLSTTVQRGDGSAVAVDVRLRLVASSPQRRALVTVRDAGPRQLVERTLRANSDLSEQLQRSQKIGALGRLAGGVAHDFNNLLQVIGGYAETLGVDPLDRESRRRVLDNIQSATDRASSLTRQLLAFGRRQVLVPQVLDLNATVRSLEHMLRRVIGEDVTLVSTLAPDLRHVKVDAGQIEQVVLNLAINARDAMFDGGTLEIATENLCIEGSDTPHGLPVAVPPGSWVHLVVRDSGSGMDAETLAQAFEPFFTTKDVSKGSGLGLSMVYGIVKQSGGYTWIESELGAGTTVHVLLRGVDAAVEVRPAGCSAPAMATDLGSGTVLIVEDDPEVRTLFAAFLRQAGYDVLEAADGREALELFERPATRIDLVVTDVVMPNVSGPALAGALRARRPDVKLLYVSGYNEQAALEAVHGPDAVHLPKPVTRTALVSQVAALLAGSPGPSAHSA